MSTVAVLQSWCREGELNPQVEPFCGRERSVSPQAKS